MRIVVLRFFRVDIYIYFLFVCCGWYFEEIKVCFVYFFYFLCIMIFFICLLY